VQVQEYMTACGSVPYPMASPVHLAAASGQRTILECLLANVTSPDVLAEVLTEKDVEGRIALHYACRFSSNVDTIRVLLEQEEKLLTRYLNARVSGTVNHRQQQAD
jgi:ankyrin repeat protein